MTDEAVTTDPQGNDWLEVGEPFYGIYWKRTGEIHRTGMTREEASEWMQDAREIFPNSNKIDDVWGVCTATWVPVN